jgi:alpha-glucosidase
VDRVLTGLTTDDVADYRDVDPKIGTLADFDAMMTAFKAAGIKVIVDIVPNHSSDDHVWFQEALRSPKGSPARDRYIFRDGLGPNKDQPPSDWVCIFGGSAWEPVGDGQWYLHLFDTSQPDFNWRHPEVRADFLTTDRGVSGFRVDVAHGLAKDMSEPLKSQEEMHTLFLETIENGARPNIHPLWDRDEVHEIYREWRKVFDEYDPPLTAVAEAWVASDRKHIYASPEGLGQSFSFDMLMCNFRRDEFRDTIEASLKDASGSGSSTTWVFSNHDVVRHATRYGLPKAVEKGGSHGNFASFCKDYLVSRGKDPVCDVELGLRRARAATLMMLALPGSAYLYQ